MGVPTPEHVLFIPAVLLIGIVVGYIMGGRAVREDIEKKRERAKK